MPWALIKVAPRGGEFYLCEIPEIFPKAEVPRHPLLISSESNWKVPRKPLRKILTNVPQSGNSEKMRQAATSQLLVYVLSWLFTTDSSSFIKYIYYLSFPDASAISIQSIHEYFLALEPKQTKDAEKLLSSPGVTFLQVAFIPGTWADLRSQAMKKTLVHAALTDWHLLENHIVSCLLHIRDQVSKWNPITSFGMGPNVCHGR